MADDEPAPRGAYTDPGHDLTPDRVPLASLQLFHKNPRRGDLEVIAESLRTNGQYKPVVVNRGSLTGRQNEVLAGNQTVLAAREAGWADLWCVFVDVDDTAAARIVAVDNRASELGSFDSTVLADLLGDLSDLDGTGYTFNDLDDLIAEIEEAGAPAAERDGDDEPVRDTSSSGPETSGVRTSNTLAQDADAYGERDTRMILLQYPVEQFEVVVRQLAALQERYGVDSNSDVVAHLAARAALDEPAQAPA